MHKQDSDTVVIIPALNQQDSLPIVLKTLQSSPFFHRIIDIIVVDNGSTDETSQKAKECGVMVIKEEKRGHGQACLAGIQKAFEISSSYIIFMNADYLANPLEFIKLLEELDDGADLVIGNKILDTTEPWGLKLQSNYGNKFALFLLKALFTNSQFTDFGSFRAIRTDSLKDLNMRKNNFSWTIEMQIKAILKKYICKEIRISYNRRTNTIKPTKVFFDMIINQTKIITYICYYFLKFKIFKQNI